MSVYKRKVNVVNPKQDDSLDLASSLLSTVANIYTVKKDADYKQKMLEIKKQEEEKARQEKIIDETLSGMERGEVVDEEMLLSQLNNEYATKFHNQTEGYRIVKEQSELLKKHIESGQIELEDGQTHLSLLQQTIKDLGLSGDALEGANRFLNTNFQELKKTTIKQLDDNTKNLTFGSIVFNVVQGAREVDFSNEEQVNNFVSNYYSIEDQVATDKRFGDNSVNIFRDTMYNDMQYALKSGELSVEQYSAIVDALSLRPIKDKDGNIKYVNGATRNSKWLIAKENANQKNTAIEKEQVKSATKNLNVEETLDFFNPESNMTEEQRIQQIGKMQRNDLILDKVIMPNGKVNVEVVNNNPEYIDLLKTTGHISSLGIEYDKNDNPNTIAAQNNFKTMAFSKLVSDRAGFASVFESAFNEETGEIDYDKIANSDMFKDIYYLATNTKIPLTAKHTMAHSAYTKGEFVDVLKNLIQIGYGDADAVSLDFRQNLYDQTMKRFGYSGQPVREIFTQIQGNKLLTEEEKYTKTVQFLALNHEVSSTLGLENANVLSFFNSLSFGREDDKDIILATLDIFQSMLENGDYDALNFLGVDNIEKMTNLNKVRVMAETQVDLELGVNKNNVTATDYRNKVVEKMDTIFDKNEKEYQEAIINDNYTNDKISRDGTILKAIYKSSSSSDILSETESENQKIIAETSLSQTSVTRPLSGDILRKGVNRVDVVNEVLNDLGIQLSNREDGYIKVFDSDSVINSALNFIGVDVETLRFGDKVPLFSPSYNYMEERIQEGIARVDDRLKKQNRKDISEGEYKRELKKELSSARFGDNIITLDNGRSIVFPRKLDETDKDRIAVKNVFDNTYANMKTAVTNIFENTEDYSEGLSDAIINSGLYEPRFWFTSMLGFESKEVSPPFSLDFDYKDTTDSSPEGSLIINWDQGFVSAIEAVFKDKNIKDLPIGDREFVSEMIDAGLGYVDGYTGEFMFTRKIPYKKVVDMQSRELKEMEKRKKIRNSVLKNPTSKIFNNFGYWLDF